MTTRTATYVAIFSPRGFANEAAYYRLEGDDNSLAMVGAMLERADGDPSAKLTIVRYSPKRHGRWSEMQTAKTSSTALGYESGLIDDNEWARLIEVGRAVVVSSTK